MQMKPLKYKPNDTSCPYTTLCRCKGAHILYPLAGGRSFVGRKALIAKDGEAFLQRKLEPVAAGDAVARPVVEIFMCHDCGDGIEIGVGRGVGIGQDIA